MKAIHRKFNTQYLSTQCSNCNWTYEQVGDESARELARKEAIAHVEKTGHKIWFVARTPECIEPDPNQLENKMCRKIDYDNADVMHDITKELRAYLNTFTSFKTPELEAELIKLQKTLHTQCRELNKNDFSS